MAQKEICIIGTPHIRLDQSNQYFLETYQRYLEDATVILNKLEQYNPDLIAIEWDIKNKNQLDKDFNQLSRKHLPLQLNEHHFLAIPLALKLNLPTVIPIDNNQMQTRKIRAAFADEYLENDNPILYQHLNEAKQSHQNKKGQDLSLYEQLTEYQDSVIPLEQVFAIRSLADSPSIAFSLEWLERNQFMANHIMKNALNHDRTVVFTGMSHVRILKFMLESTGLFKVVPSIDILK
ncbi:DUF5694 domain-containing protein [Mammaliicoccus sciuri]|uniref:DUF5694 domain-containing protein n=1 Tax=Mammaliicoccus TaxID=2803850 RepID=UPI001950151E|nr:MULTISPECIES: DUF5694 domain-containing protein [Mammaliicoccus]MCE4979388.1 hypothetical protein [Mammaliicoccus sciuri]MCE5084264.1 hypothetical protein [Mammaliicoccus sciuri]MCE5093836.1 hypothetical protein [Mammaliicoccus sciuri]MDT0668809.1 DUF5694 domain-containing protein [Mammaliicoccus sciuri]MDT0710104.1 DUF5694 domain-containing protein [Mammaliicoccus sciuri]